MKPTIKFLTISVLLIAFMLSCCSCSNNKSTKTLTIASPREPGSLDWQYTNTMNASPILTNITESLLRYNADGELEPGCAEKYSVSEDGLIYTFTLRDDLKWSNGKNILAKDFIDSWLRAIDPSTGSLYVDMFLDYIHNAREYYEGKVSSSDVGFAAPDDKTIVVTLKESVTYFPEIAALWTYAPVNMETVNQYPTTWASNANTIVSNGAFYVSNIIHGSEYVLKKNEFYWDNKNVKLDEVIIKIIPDAHTSSLAFDTKSVDGVLSVPTSIAFDRVADSSKTLSTSPSFGSSHLIFNCSEGIFKDEQVRKAFSLAVDRNKIVSSLLKTGEKAGDGLIPPGYIINNKDYSDGKNYNMQAANYEEARNLLSAAGYSDRSKLGTIRFLVYTDTTLATIAEYLEYSWETELGVDVEVITQDWAAHYDNILNFNFEIAAFGYSASIFHPMDFFDAFRTGFANNASGYSCAEYDVLVSQLRGETDSEKAEQLMRSAEEVIMNDYPVIILYHNVRHTLMQSTVSNWYLTPMNALVLRYADIE